MPVLGFGNAWSAAQPRSPNLEILPADPKGPIHLTELG